MYMCIEILNALKAIDKRTEKRFKTLKKDSEKFDIETRKMKAMFK